MCIKVRYVCNSCGGYDPVDGAYSDDVQTNEWIEILCPTSIQLFSSRPCGIIRRQALPHFCYSCFASNYGKTRQTWNTWLAKCKVEMQKVEAMVANLPLDRTPQVYDAGPVAIKVSKGHYVKDNNSHRRERKVYYPNEERPKLREDNAWFDARHQMWKGTLPTYRGF